ncbi:MAG: NAD-dependent epimerase/dehydratase family protein [Methylococcales bacterium]|nr:NAD-dependent epimerase/dehydratase family protein [Methylococcales bacterium]
MTNQNDSWKLDHDLEYIFTASENIFKNLKGARIFLTGGTGFIGCWLLESLRYAESKLQADIQVTVLTRNYQAFLLKAPHLAQSPNFKFIEGHVADFEFPDGAFSHIIHAATDASAMLNENNPIKMFDTVVNGTHHVLDFAAEKKPERILFLSSGAVYGQQPYDVEHVKEDWRGAPDCLDPKAAYAEGKRAAEMLCSIYGKQYGLHISTARIFALLGPYLSLDIHFAAGNFIRDAMQGKTVEVNGNGLPCRSYLYAADLVVWLWHILQRGERNKAYNVGSDESISIRDLAALTARVLASGEYRVLGANDGGWNLGRYVPDTGLIGRELGLKKTVSLEESIRRTALWHGWKGK